MIWSRSDQLPGSVQRCLTSKLKASARWWVIYHYDIYSARRFHLQVFNSRGMCIVIWIWWTRAQLRLVFFLQVHDFCSTAGPRIRGLPFQQRSSCCLFSCGFWHRKKAGAGTFDSLVECQARWLHREADEARIFFWFYGISWSYQHTLDWIPCCKILARCLNCLRGKFVLAHDCYIPLVLVCSI